ncbi:Riboflavin synthase-like beta-barrel [Penicillium capsulatum]|uniref:Riboflavin synthase-like beta-barrel n=1 Tax=Penicillium capsulatum TaxID=69766 RepID=A0A9W9HNY0_9EURO|nr:Riboflavin synthase-like beta-barrel [Penicillium capsulatum]KAJ6105439.1 Riboflavin synthase-like beta-barrel [Penicillium capsulatum]
MPSAIPSRPRKGTFQDIPVSSTSHPDNPIPEEPRGVRSLSITNFNFNSVTSQDTSSNDSSPATPITPPSDSAEESLDHGRSKPTGRQRRASTVLISQNSEDMRRVLENVGTGGTQKIQSSCCGGGCCRGRPLQPLDGPISGFNSILAPENQAFDSLNLNLDLLTLDSDLSDIAPLPEKTVFFSQVPAYAAGISLGPADHPPQFVQPHPPYEVYRAPLHHARELTKGGAEKRTYHFDIDVTDYPAESGMVDFVVGGAIGVCPKNKDEEVEDVLDLLCVPRSMRDKKVLMRTTNGRWPTIWGDEKPRELVTTRREVLSWCSDIQSYAPTKALFRLLAEYTSEQNEKKVLEYLASAQGQSAFCELRTNSHISLSQLLHAFPSSQPPLDHLLSVLNTLMPRFYSLSQDPLISCQFKGSECRRLVEVAVTVAESDDWRGGSRTGVGSGYLERLAQRAIAAEAAGEKIQVHIPMFRGLMANPLATKFASDGPMLLIGAGVGIAPFRGFVQRRLQSANCANKVWVLQGVRDSLLDELYSGEWGVHEDKVRTVVQSRRGESRYVQEEVRHQADLVWYVINALDGRVFVCGSGKGMGEGVEAALVEVAMAKGNLNAQEADLFWQRKKEAGQYIAVSSDVASGMTIR